MRILCHLSPLPGHVRGVELQVHGVIAVIDCVDIVCVDIVRVDM